MKKTKRDVVFFVDRTFSNTEKEKQKRASEIAKISSTELSELLSQFILSVCAKEGQDYELPKFRGMVASFKRHRHQ